MFMGGAISTVLLTVTGRYGILFLTKMATVVYKQFTITVKVTDTQSKYTNISCWIQENSKNFNNVEIQDSWDRNRKNIGRLTPANGSFILWYRNLPVVVIKGEKETSSRNVNDYCGWIKVVFIFRRDIKEVSEVFEHEPAVRVKETMVTTWREFGWERICYRFMRGMESVILDMNTKFELEEDLNKFLVSQEKYIDLGILYKRGYLLYGPPGTGKTSLIFAIASFTKRDLSFLSLRNLSDSAAIGAFSALNPNTILVLEDVDCMVMATKKRGSVHIEEVGGKSVSLSTLLNLLDGAFSREGIITIMTTNHMDDIDPALLRPGRIDHRVFCDLFDYQLAKEMVERLIPGSDPDKYLDGLTFPISGATLQGYLMDTTPIL
jgi:chaperone BCS1